MGGGRGQTEGLDTAPRISEPTDPAPLPLAALEEPLEPSASSQQKLPLLHKAGDSPLQPQRLKMRGLQLGSPDDAVLIN